MTAKIIQGHFRKKPNVVAFFVYEHRTTKLTKLFVGRADAKMPGPDWDLLWSYTEVPVKDLKRIVDKYAE